MAIYSPSGPRPVGQQWHDRVKGRTEELLRGRPLMAKAIPHKKQKNPGAKVAGDPVETIDVSGARPNPVSTTAGPELTPMTVPAPLPQPGDANWNDTSRYQIRPSDESGPRGGMPTGGSPVTGGLHDAAADARRGIYEAAHDARPTGVGPVSQQIHRMADRGVGSALTRGLMGGESRNNARTRYAANLQRQNQGTSNQISNLLNNGRTIEQALDELGLRGDPQWDDSARQPMAPRPQPNIARPRGRYDP